MTKTDLQERVQSILSERHGDCVYSVEDGVVWVSGMNAHCTSVARGLAATLVGHDVPCGLVYDDGVHARDFGGVQFNYGPRTAQASLQDAQEVLDDAS